jgi:stalled ribosome alternative rescue factor ArfA
MTKQMKKEGKVTIKGPKVKERKAFAPATKVESPKKGKGSYTRSKKITESNDISRFIECLLAKNYADANKHLNQVVETKLQNKIQQELNTPLFDK